MIKYDLDMLKQSLRNFPEVAAAYLNNITTEVYDVKSILNEPDEQVLQDRHLIKSLKYSTIVIAEAIGSLFQHILAKEHSACRSGIYGSLCEG